MARTAGFEPATFGSVAQLLYFLAIFGGGRD